MHVLRTRWDVGDTSYGLAILITVLAHFYPCSIVKQALFQDIIWFVKLIKMSISDVETLQYYWMCYRATNVIHPRCYVSPSLTLQPLSTSTVVHKSCDNDRDDNI